MNTKTLSLASLLAGASMALPSAKRQVADGAAFGLMAIRSGSDIQYAQFDAALSSIFLNLPSMNATCDSYDSAPDSASFYIQDGGLFLYSTSATPQQAFVDRSGMGQGKFGYTTGAQSLGKNWEQTNFTLDANNVLTFNGAGFLACPNSIENSWSVWVSAGVDQPAGNSNCTGIEVEAVALTDPVSCSYTQ